MNKITTNFFYPYLITGLTAELAAVQLVLEPLVIVYVAFEHRGVVAVFNPASKGIRCDDVVLPQKVTRAVLDPVVDRILTFSKIPSFDQKLFGPNLFD